MRTFVLGVFALLCCFSVGLSQEITPKKGSSDENWPQWRGPQRNGISLETGLLREWPKGGPKLLWNTLKVNKEPSVGSGMSSLVIAGGKIYTMGDLPKFEQVEFKNKEGQFAKKNVNKAGVVCCFCLDAETGKEIWKSVIGPPSSGGPGGGTRCTPTVDGDRVYAVTTQGKLVCLKTGDGAILWQKDLVKEFGGRPPGFGGYAESPTIDGDKLICAPGGKTCMVALNKLTGDTYWTSASPKTDGTGFASVVKAEVDGVKMYITLAHNQLGLIGVEADTGKFLWNYARVANGTANIPTPVVKDNLVFGSRSRVTELPLSRFLRMIILALYENRRDATVRTMRHARTTVCRTASSVCEIGGAVGRRQEEFTQLFQAPFQRYCQANQGSCQRRPETQDRRTAQS